MRRELLVAFIALGLVSLFADITYEGGRSVSGSFLNMLGALPLAAGLLGVGEFISYVMRLVGGVAAQRLRSGGLYWALVFAGYSTNLAIPLLALAGSWELALTLYLVERVGKGLRAPARDVILAEVTEGIGRGKGFGLHELMDQVGAVAGPAIISWSAASSSSAHPYRAGFSVLAVPAALSLIALGVACRSYPTPKATVVGEEGFKGFSGLGRPFWLYLAGTSAALVGFLHWGVVSYILQDLSAEALVTPVEVPLLYLIAMGADALVALPAGFVYDRVGVAAVSIAPVAAAPVAALLLLSPARPSLYAASALWGVAMGFVETVMRAAVADIAPEGRMPIAYGVFSFTVGVAWMGGSLAMSLLYQAGLRQCVIALSVAAELASLALLTHTGRRSVRP